MYTEIEDVDDVASELTDVIFHNVLASGKKRTWKTSKSFKMARKVSDDEVAKEFADIVFGNVLATKRDWKDSRPYVSFEKFAGYDFEKYDMKIRFKELFVTVKTNNGAKNPFFERFPWLSRIPSETREHAAFKAAAAFRSAMTNFSNGNINHYIIKNDTMKKDDSGYIFKNADDFETKKKEKKLGYTIGVGLGVKFEKNELKILPSFLGQKGVRYFEKPPISGKTECACQIIKDICGDFWIVVPFYAKKKPRRSEKIVAIDPGISEPFACYTPNGNVNGFVLGENMNERLKVIADTVSNVDTRLQTSCGRERNELLERRRRLFRKADRVRDDSHWKIINDITSEFGIVMLPHLRTGYLCGNLRAKTNRKMFGISHYIFLQRMKFKCSERNVDFIDADERYSTKTCGCCGHTRLMKLSDRVFHCRFCGLMCHRDLQAARNIYMINIEKIPDSCVH